MCFQEVHLFLELLRVCPIIVPLAKSNVFTPGGGHCPPLVSQGTKILFRREQTDFIGVGGRILFANCPCSVRAAIFGNNHFYRESSFLCEEALYGFPNPLFVVVGNGDGGKQVTHQISHSIWSRIMRAGTPAARAPAGISRVTTLPAPITAPSPMETPLRIMEFIPIQT